jgi:pimeloyl-ACP methyl ester carboxylesterase
METSRQRRAASQSALPRRGAWRVRDGAQLAHDRIEAPAANGDVLFLHGFGQTRQSWGPTAARLAAAGWSSHAVDGRGHGESTWNDPAHPYRMEQFSTDVLDIVAQLPRKPVLVGASMGGLLGLLAEGESPGLFEALVLVDITPRWDAGGVARILDFMSAHPEGFDDLEHAADEIAAYLPHRRRRKSPEELSSLLVRRDDGRWRWHWDPRLMAEVARDGERHQPRLVEAAARVRIPTLLVSGGLSDLVSDATVGEFLALVPHASHVRIADATHMVAGDRNDAFTGAILDFLTTLPPGGVTPGAAP